MTLRSDGEVQPALTGAAAEDVRVVAKGGAVQIAGQISARLLSFAFFFVAFRFLGTARVGLYRQATQVLAIASQVGLSGFNYAAMRYIARARAVGRPGGVRGAARIALAGAAIASGVVFVALVAAADLVAAPFVDPGQDQGEFATLLRIGAPYVPLVALMQVLRYCTQAYRTMVPSVIVGSIVQPAARFVLGIAALVAGFAVTGLVGSLVLSVLVGAVVAAWYYRRILTPDERAAEPEINVGPMVRFALPQAGSSLFSIQDLGLGIILLGILGTDFQAGLFTAAIVLQGPGTVFLGGIVNIWAPVVADLYGRGEIARLQSLYQTLNRWTATFSFPVFAALVLEGDLFVRLFADVKDPDAGVVVAILAAGNFFYTGTGPTGYVLSMTGRPGVNFINSIVAVAVYIALGIWLVPRYGPIGMAVVNALVTAGINSARVIEAKLLVGVQPFGRTFFKPVVATLVGAAVLLAWRALPGDTVWLQAAGIVVAATAYLIVLRALGIDPEERHVIERVRARFRRKKALEKPNG